MNSIKLIHMMKLHSILVEGENATWAVFYEVVLEHRQSDLFLDSADIYFIQYYPS